MATTRPARRLILLALLVVTSWGSAAPQGRGQGSFAAGWPLRFDSEWIRLSIEGDSLEVRGTYVLVCREATEAPFPLFYPFPHDDRMGGTRMVALWGRVSKGSLEPLRWEELEGIRGVRWWLPPCSEDTLVIESVYRQALLGEYARYIVTTTRLWGGALRHARFDLRLPRGAVPVDFSFPFIRRGTDGDLFYSFAADSFFPDRDIVVRWKP